MDFEHKHRGQWTRWRPDELGAHLTQLSELLADQGGWLAHMPRPVEIKEVNCKNRSRIKGQLLERQWPSWLGFLPTGRALYVEPLSTACDELRLSLVPPRVLDWLGQAAACGAVSVLYVRTSTPRDYLIEFDREGDVLSGARSMSWRELEAARVRPGERWWERWSASEGIDE